jgi:PilZ domain
MSSAFGLPNTSRSASQGRLSDMADKAHRSTARKPEHQLEDISTQLNGDVAYCHPEEAGFSRRRELRYPVNFTGQLTMRDCSSPIKTRVVDMSLSGLGLMLPVAVEVGTFVAVEIERGTFFGEIRHCLAATGFFRAGIQIEEFMRAKV